MVKRRVGGLVKAYVLSYICCFYCSFTLDWMDGLRKLTMKMKDFKAALRSKLNYIEKNLKVEDDYYLGYISCMEDILEFIDGGEESQEIDNI